MGRGGRGEKGDERGEEREGVRETERRGREGEGGKRDRGGKRSSDRKREMEREIGGGVWGERGRTVKSKAWGQTLPCATHR